MMKQKITVKNWLLLGLLIVLLASCKPSGPSDTEQAQTFAAQTLAAMPSATISPEPTQTSTPTATFTATPIPTVGAVGPADFPDYVNPLTGQVMLDLTLLDRRPVFVKVANYPASGRPHAGLSSADMVFEYYIGYGGNRFIALFYGQDANKIGPVRSGRLVDPKLVNMYQGILGFQGAYVTILDQIKEVLGDRAISGTGNVCPAICDDGRNIVTSVFADSEALTKLAGERGVDNSKFKLEGMAFDLQVPEGGEDGAGAMIIYSDLNRGEWRFDEDSGSYLRWIEDAQSQELVMIPLVDSNTDEQLAFSNVVVIYANYTEYAPSMHDVDLWGNTSGKRAVIFRDGQAYDVSWLVPKNDQPMQFVDQDGEVLPLKPGNTWVAIFGTNSTDTVDEGLWTFKFMMP